MNPSHNSGKGTIGLEVVIFPCVVVPIFNDVDGGATEVLVVSVSLVVGGVGGLVFILVVSCVDDCFSVDDFVNIVTGLSGLPTRKKKWMFSGG